jgi:hypothetical protein
MKRNREIVVLVLLIAALALYLLFRDRDGTRYELPVLPKIEAGKVTAVAISRGGETGFELVRKGDGWVLLPGDYPADRHKVEVFLEEIAKFDLTALVSESKNYEPYDLTADKRIRVAVREGDREMFRFDLGKAASTYRHTFVRVGEDPRVYHVRGNLRSQFDRSAADLRDKGVLSFNRDEITEIAFVSGGKTFRWKREDVPAGEGAAPSGEAKKEGEKKKIRWVSDTGAEADGDTAARLLESLSSLACDGYLEGKKKEDFGEPLYAIRLKGRGEYALFLYPGSGEGKERFSAVSSGSPYPFFLEGYRAETLKKTLEALEGVKP